MEQRAAIKFFGELKKTATGTFQMLKSAYGEECSSRTSVFEWHKRFKEGRESLEYDDRIKTMLAAFFMLKVSFITNLCRKNRL
jgi:hypothetical protein